MDNCIYTVTDLNTYVKELLDHDAGLAAVSVEGEISNYSAAASGHRYFSLKDDQCVLKCVMWAGSAAHLRFHPQNGMKVVAMGRVSVYPKSGVYQLNVSAMMPSGIGDLRLAFEQLRERLEAEGLFDSRHKKPLPRFPRKIAVITSPEGRAVGDICTTLRARWPMAKVCVLPVRVQGVEAAGEISRALDYANAHQVADLIITGRGGGSEEELWSFNEEVVARAIYRSTIPVISAVGHEADVAISDYVADERASTPTKAAEIAVPDQKELRRHLEQLSFRLSHGASRELSMGRERLRRFSTSRALSDPMNMVRDRRQLLDQQSRRLAAALVGRLGREKERFAAAAAKLDAMSPLKVLGRGYAIPQQGKRVVLSAEELHENDQFTLRMRDGVVPCRVEKG